VLKPGSWCGIDVTVADRTSEVTLNRDFREQPDGEAATRLFQARNNTTSNKNIFWRHPSSPAPAQIRGLLASVRSDLQQLVGASSGKVVKSHCLNTLEGDFGFTARGRRARRGGFLTILYAVEPHRMRNFCAAVFYLRVVRRLMLRLRVYAWSG